MVAYTVPIEWATLDEDQMGVWGGGCPWRGLRGGRGLGFWPVIRRLSGGCEIAMCVWGSIVGRKKGELRRSRCRRWGQMEVTWCLSYCLTYGLLIVLLID